VGSSVQTSKSLIADGRGLAIYQARVGFVGLLRAGLRMFEKTRMYAAQLGPKPPEVIARFREDPPDRAG